jgi:hypothetical protein
MFSLTFIDADRINPAFKQATPALLPGYFKGAGKAKPGRQNPWVGGTRPPDTSSRELSLSASFSDVEIWDVLF